jgi:hypothetical protein
MHRRRIWCETVPAETLGAPATVALLRRYAVDPLVAVWPDTIAEAREATLALAGAGLRPALWPMLADADGRWISAGNAPRFCAFAERLAQETAREVGAVEIVLDLEPPIELIRGALAAKAVNAHLLSASLDAGSFRAAREAIAAVAARLHAAGCAVSAAVALPVLLGPGWEALLGTPVSGVAWDHVSPMLYTSMLEGWSRGLLARRDARALLAWSCRAAALRFGPIAGASLGAVGTGAFGDEPTYRSPAELADDVAVARAAGLDDLALFELGGVLRRAPAEAWLSAFTRAEPAARLPEATPRARAAIAGARVAGAALGALLRAPPDVTGVAPRTFLRT